MTLRSPLTTQVHAHGGEVLPAFDWIKKMREAGKPVISGFVSAIEKDVLGNYYEANNRLS